MHRRGRSIGFVALLAALTAGCSDSENQPSENAADKAAAPKASLTTGSAKTSLGEAELLDVVVKREPINLVVPLAHSTTVTEKVAHQVTQISATIELPDANGGSRVVHVSTNQSPSGPYEQAANTKKNAPVAADDVVLPLSDEDSDAVRTAVEGGTAAVVTSKARVSVDTDGDEKADSEHTIQQETKVPALTSPQAKQQSLAATPKSSGGITIGSNACALLAGGNSEGCVSVRGKVWLSGGLWHSNTQQIRCPDGLAAVLRLSPFFGGDPYFVVDTKSGNKFSGGSTWYSFKVGDDYGGGSGVNVSLTDYTVRGHPIHYTPVIACSVNGSDWVHYTGEHY